MKDILKDVITQLVDDKNAVEIVEEPIENGFVYRIKTAQTDIGRLIGKSGKTINSLRTIFKAAGLKKGQNIRIELFEDTMNPENRTEAHQIQTESTQIETPAPEENQTV